MDKLPLSSASLFWEEKWQGATQGWDIGYASPAIIEYADSYPNKEAAILIPGCGNAYEAEELVRKGFTNVTVLDVAPSAIERIQKKLGKVPSIRIVLGDFFLHDGSYDLIFEQTFFCALHPGLREHYARKAAALLKTSGKLAGVLFSRQFDTPGPPFGGTAEEYRSIFSPLFSLCKLEPCYNSIKPRQNNELFIELMKREVPQRPVSGEKSE